MTPDDLKAARLRLGLTQKALAEALSKIGFSVKHRTVQNWEQGLPRNPLPKGLLFALEKLEALNARDL